MTDAPPPASAESAQRRLVVAAVTLVSLVWLLLVARAPDLIADTARDLLLARDCSELGHCLTVGAKTSVDGFYQGGAWVQWIAALQFFSGAVFVVQAAVIALQVLSCSVLCLILSRHFSLFVSALAALLWLAVLCYLGDHSLLWNHSGMALPAVLADGALLVFVSTRRPLALSVAAFWTGFGMGFHMECAILFPVVVAFAVLAARRPWLALPAMLSAFLLGLLPTSLEATRANLVFLAHSHAGIPLLLGAAALVAVATLLRGRFLRARQRTQVAWLAGAIVVPPAAVLGWLGLRGHLVAMRYLYTALPAAAAVAAAAIHRACRAAARRSGRPALEGLLAGALASGLLFVGGMAGPETPQPNVWTEDDAKMIAARLDASGYSYDAARWHLQGPYAWELITVLAAYLPPPRTPPLPLEKPDLLLLRPAPSNVQIGSLLHPGSRPPLYVRSIRPWLRITRGRVCILPIQSDRNTEPRCSELATHIEGPDGFRFRARSYPRLFDSEAKPPYRERFVIPISPEGRDQRRFIHLIDRSLRCRWRVTRVGGVRYQARLPARDVVVERGERGSLTVERRVDPASCPGQVERYMRPSIAETHPAETRLRRALEAH